MVAQPKQPAAAQAPAGKRTPAQSGISRALILGYGVGVYLVFLVALLYAVGFVEDIGAPTALDSGRPGAVGVSIAVDVALLALFAAQHSIMARPRFKVWWTRIIPASVERSTYVLLSSLSLLLLFWQWRPLTAVAWQVDNPAGRAVLLGLSLAGWLIALASTFLINHFDLLGLQQVYGAWRRWAYTAVPFRATGLYRLVRHPLMLGFLIAFWAAPTMTLGHLLFALATTGYIVLAVRYLEEPELLAALGDRYVAYRRRVPMLLPVPRPRP